MNQTILKILRAISHTAFWAVLGMILLAIFVKPWTIMLIKWSGVLFIIATVFSVLYEFINHRLEMKQINARMSGFTYLPAGFYQMTDKLTNTALGTLSQENVDFLRKKFLEQDMSDNDFYFLEETLEAFLEEEKPGQELTAFLNNAIKDRSEIELHWEPSK